MKKNITSSFILLSLSISAIGLNAQNPKLNNAFNFSSGIVIDSKGNAFVTGRNDRIIKISPQGKAELFAGGGQNNVDGKGKNAGFSYLAGITIDEADNLYVSSFNKIKKVTPDGNVTTIAGTDKRVSMDGDRSTATFLQLGFITIDHWGNIYVVDKGKAGVNNIIRKITSQGHVSTIKNAPGEDKDFKSNYIRGLACDVQGNLYVCVLALSSCIKKITPEGNISIVTGRCDATKITAIFKEGDINTAQIVCPTGLAINKAGELFFSDVRLHRIVKISKDKVMTVAGNSKITYGNIAGGADPGYQDGKAKQALFYAPLGIAFDKNGNLFIVDGSSKQSSYIRKLSPDGHVSTFCMHVWNPKTEQYEEPE